MKFKLKKINRQQTSSSNSVFRLLSYLFLAIIAVLIVTLLSYQLAYYHRLYPGIKIAGVNVGNKTPSEAKQLLVAKLSLISKNGLVFSFKGEIKTYNLETLGVNYNLDQAIKSAYFIGRGPNILTNLTQKFLAWVEGYNLSPHFSFNNQKVDDALGYFGNRIAKKPQEALVAYENAHVTITPPENGIILDTLKAKENLNDNLNTFSISPILLEQKTVTAQVSREDAEKYRSNLETILKTPLKLTFGPKAWVLSGSDLASLISFSDQTNQADLTLNLGPKSYVLEKISVANSKNKPYGLIKLNLDQNELKTYLEKIASQIDQEPVDAKFNFSQGKVNQFRPAQDGQKLDLNDTAAKLNQLFSGLQTANLAQTQLALKVAITQAKVTTESVNTLGIKELLGRGDSTFFHSIPNRAANIQLAASRIDGTLVPPGETFSMSKTIGEVDSSTGYKEAYIISKGKTQLDFGGGVCQVSTTLFRAALNSGLPIVERHPHAYRVGYYEQNSSPGIDASVFFPYSDFRFKNDTANYILIQTKFNPAASSLSFEFYGTKDGRQVSLSKPIVSNQKPPPPDVHQDDPTLALGTVKQIDFSAWGATTSFNRSVIKDGVTTKDTFTSVYQPWQAIFLHGTKVG